MLSFVGVVKQFCKRAFIRPVCSNLFDEVVHNFFENVAASTKVVHMSCVCDLIHKIVHYAHGGQLSEVECEEIVSEIVNNVDDIFELIVDSARFTYDSKRTATGEMIYIVITTKYGKVLPPIFIDESVM